MVSLVSTSAMPHQHKTRNTRPPLAHAQAASETSSFRSHGTWTRKLIPESVEVSQGTYELPSLNVTGIASDLVMILMGVGTSCLAVAVYGACSSRKSKKWETVYDGEVYFFYFFLHTS